MAAKFGTSGLRGLVQDLVGDPARRHVQAFVLHLCQSHSLARRQPVYVGWDYRDSSPRLAADVVAALQSEGHEAILCGHVPTPVLAFSAIAAQAPSIMITGSHIPADRNGLKFFLPTGEISKWDEQQIAAQAPQMRPTQLTVSLDDMIVGPQQTDAVERFSARMQPLLSHRPLAGWLIGVYQHSTVARDLLVDMLSNAGATCVALGRSETFIPVDTEAVSPETQKMIADWCRDGAYNAIVSADGDGDRPLVADAQGDMLRGDFLGIVASRLLNASVIATPVTSNSGIETACRADVMRTRVGSPYVVEAMSQAVAQGRSGVVGFEANGGFLTATPCSLASGIVEALPTRDCFLPVLATLVTASEQGASLADLQRSYALPCAAADRLQNFPIEAGSRLLEHLSTSTRNIEAFLGPAVEVDAVNTVDGLRITLRGGDIVHFRTSGNAPEFRCYVEHRTQAGAERLLAQGLEAVRQYSSFF